MAIKFLNTVAVDTSVLYVNAANNRVGINTVSPGNTLSVGDGTVDESLAVYHSDGTFTRINGYGLYMSRSASYIRPTSGNSQTLYIGNVTKPWSGTVYNANTHYFRSGANENMRITSSGKVGIGTTSPSYRFTAYGSSANSEIVASFGSANDVNEYTAIGLSGFIASNGATKAGLALKRTSTYGTGELHFLNNNTTDNSDMTLSDSKMMINSAGKVGIGTTSPSAKLHVSSSGDTILRVTSADGNAAFLDLGDASDPNGGRIVYDSGSNLALYTASSERMRIASDGKVGIGTTNPSTILNVNSQNPILKLKDSDGTHRYAGLSLETNGGQWNLSNGDSTTAINSNLYITRSTTGSDNRFIFHRDSYYFGVYDNTNTIKTIIRANGDSYFNGGSLGLGTTSPNAKLDIISGTNNGIRISATDTTSNWRDIDIKSYVSQAQANAFPDGSAIYTTNPSGQTETAFSKYGGLVIQGRDDGNSSFAIRLGNGSGYATRMFMGETGATVFSNQVTATNFITSSDERLKENIKEAFGDKVEVNWKTFELKTDKGHKRYGVIAQDLEKNHPEFVKTDNEGMKSVAYTDLLIAKIAELENRIQTLENK